MVEQGGVALPDSYAAQVDKSKVLRSPCFTSTANVQVESYKQPRKEDKTDNLIMNMAQRDHSNLGGMKVESLSYNLMGKEYQDKNRQYSN
mmetsp:Transcript_101704/g.219585  ORF Transcript_101704/g.219585 Transcript_101704/m.219585 type:complete len:90 (+) Transcript_101704:716-985(+)|eukprot:CAMPEP_0116907474 /NCGR_PEP_ID=MMETSP0467-20121206/13135_1 /TAXON_ID=283647 /ORGANISM="Mesodinium pulex, Strain SPMC105" /LENGTH=89 /DNA_ID=CAMNT_0004582515 /DNA_START=702 /DNA_END=971 /DNA_ORIENTATION=+